jgi:acyl-CoA synthetase (NDP forming)
MSRPLGERLPLDGLDPDAARALIDRCLDDGKQWLTLADGEELLATHGIELEPAAWCNEIDQAFEAAAAVGGPVAMKAGRRAPETPADFDAVPLGVEGEDAVRAGWLELLRRTRARRARLDRRDRAAAGRAWR